MSHDIEADWLRSTADYGEWVQHDGSRCPIDMSEYVHVRDNADGLWQGQAKMFQWEERPNLKRVMYYRVVDASR